MVVSMDRRDGKTNAGYLSFRTENSDVSSRSCRRYISLKFRIVAAKSFQNFCGIWLGNRHDVAQGELSVLCFMDLCVKREYFVLI